MRRENTDKTLHSQSVCFLHAKRQCVLHSASFAYRNQKYHNNSSNNDKDKLQFTAVNPVLKRTGVYT